MDTRPPDTKSICTEVSNWIDNVSAGDIQFVPSLPLLQEYVPAMIPGHLWMLTGYTSSGKSQLISQIICDAAGNHKAPTVVFSLEDSRMEKMMSCISVITGIHKKPMLLGQLEYSQLQEMNQAYGVISEWPLWIYDDVRTLIEMESIIQQHNPKVVVIDYVQNLRLSGSIYERMSHAALEIFRFPQQYGHTMIGVSQIDNQSAKEENEAVIASKGAGELVAASHTVIHLKKGRILGKYSDIHLQVKKNKAFGPCGTIEAQFNKHWTEIELGPHQMHKAKLDARRIGE